MAWKINSVIGLLPIFVTERWVRQDKPPSGQGLTERWLRGLRVCQESLVSCCASDVSLSLAMTSVDTSRELIPQFKTPNNREKLKPLAHRNSARPTVRQDAEAQESNYSFERALAHLGSTNLCILNYIYTIRSSHTLPQGQRA